MYGLTKVYIFDDNNQKFFGDGPYELLCKTEETGSLSAAAKLMGMSYSKANRIIKNAEAALGFALTERYVGGKDGGGSKLTINCKQWMDKYINYKRDCIKANQELYNKYYEEK